MGAARLTLLHVQVSPEQVCPRFKPGRWQTKPKTTIHGDLYYEGKEFETKLREKKPGKISDELRTALGMPTNTDKVGVVECFGCLGDFAEVIEVVIDFDC